jgi:hypothetical protein
MSTYPVTLSDDNFYKDPAPYQSNKVPAIQKIKSGTRHSSEEIDLRGCKAVSSRKHQEID